VIMKDKKEYGGYLDYLDELNLSFDVDVVVKGAEESLRGDFACQILGAFEVLHGDGEYLSKTTKNFNPSFKEAYAVLRKVKRDMDSVGSLCGKKIGNGV